MNDGGARALDSRYAWLMVALAGLFMSMSPGAMSSISVFLKPISADMGWLRGETSFAYMAATLFIGLSGILMGLLSDRYSVRPVVLGGAAVLGVSFLLLSYQNSLGQFYLFYAMTGMGVSTFDAPLLASVGNWFDRNKGLALGVASACRGLGNGIVPFTAAYLISVYGWRGAYTGLGIYSLAVLLPLALLLRNPPAPPQAVDFREASSAPGESPTAAPWAVTAWISAAAIFCCACMATPLVHAVALAQDRGIGAQKAAGILLVLSIASFMGRIAYGKLTDSIGGLRTYMLASLSQTLLVFWFTQMTSLTGFYALAFFFGLFYSGVMVCMVVCVREFVPAQMRGVSIGVVFFFAWLGMGLGAYQGGYFFDLTGGYTVSFLNSALAGVINLAILLSLQRFILKRKFVMTGAAAA